MTNFRMIDNEKTIIDLFNNLSKHEEIPISVQIGDCKNFAMLKFDEKPQEPYFEFNDFEEIIDSGEEAEITFFYKETFINFKSEIAEILENKLYINYPLNICTSFNRTKTRYKILKEDNVFISIFGAENMYPVIDISTSGLSFEADRNFFDEGQVIRNIMLVLGGSQNVYVDAVVKNISSISDNYFRYGVKFLSIEWIFHQQIFSFIFEKSYPDIQMMKDFSSEDVSSLYDKSKYIRLKNSSYTTDIMANILKLEKLKNKPMIAISLIQQREGNIESIVSALRIYNQAFYIQQILSPTEEDIGSFQKTDMYAGIIDSLLGHPYFESLLMYVNNDVEWFLEMLRIMKEIINDDDKIMINPFEVYQCLTETNYEESSERVIVSDNIEEFLANCSINIPEIEMRTFCYYNYNFHLQELTEIYQSMGYFLSRKLFVLKDEDEVLAFAVAEVFSEEVDIEENLNCVKIYKVSPNFDINKQIEPLLNQISALYKKFNISKFVVISNKDIKNNKLEKRESVHRILMSREGVVEFLYFIKANIV